ncbi:MAG: hypothetical protein FWF88_11480 [Peptococcaceae bacterium]|nr:hypothetical protein [Peptococcaceae bacterium]
MKAKSEILGLCIVNIQTADEIGKIRDVLLDPASKGIAFYVLAEPSDYFGARLISQKHAVGLGGFALTVTGEQVIEDVAHCPQAIELLKGDVQVVGTHALSDKGVLLGMIRQIFFDEMTGVIVRYRVENEEGWVFDIDGASVVTMGGNFTIFLDSSELIGVCDNGQWATGNEQWDNDVNSLTSDNGQLAAGDEPDSFEAAGVDGEDEVWEDDADTAGYDKGEERVLEVAARPLSAAEMALVKAAESLRQKYATEALRAQGLEYSNEMKAAVQPSLYGADQVAAAQGGARGSARVGKAAGGDRANRAAGAHKHSGGAGTADAKRPGRAVEMKETRIRGGETELSVRAVGSAALAESMEPISEREPVSRRPDEGGREVAALKQDKPSQGKPASKRNHDEGGLSAADLIYPKDFNLFDRRQMQFLLGKRLSQAVRVDSGEVMEEGEYITAEMLSRVRTRNTLMELTAHVRAVDN